MKNVLVTGGAGFIGSHTVDLLLRRGCEVRVYDALQERVHPRGWPAHLPAGIDRVRGDVRDAEALRRALQGIDGVVHLAAYQDYMPDFGTYFAVNAVGTALLFEAIVSGRLPVRKIVLASSQAVYGEGSYRCGACGTVHPPARSREQLARGDWEVRCPSCGGPAEPLPLTEELPPHPHTAYGISKYSLEMTALSLGRRYGIPVTNMRYSIVQGRRNSFYNAYSGVARIFTLQLLHGRAPVVYEDGRQRRDYVHVEDVARANLLALEDDRTDFTSLNVAGGRTTTVLEVARMLSAICGRERLEPEVSGEYRLGDARHTVSSGERIGRLGWRPASPPEEFLRDYVEWVRQQPDLGEFYARSRRRMRAAGVIGRAAAAAAEAP